MKIISFVSTNGMFPNLKTILGVSTIQYILKFKSHINTTQLNNQSI